MFKLGFNYKVTLGGNLNMFFICMMLSHGIFFNSKKCSPFFGLL
jgi:hypothetical protein